VLLVDGLLADAECVGDLLPGPAARPRVAHLEQLEAVGEVAQRADGAEPGVRVVGRGGGGDVGGGGHDVNVG
jgi:hypothetical protein